MWHKIKHYPGSTVPLVKILPPAKWNIGEVLGLTWDCVDISDESIKNGLASVFINKEIQRVPRAAFEALEKKRCDLRFP